VKRITITYGGIDYTIGEADLDELKARIQGAYETGKPQWLRANQGEGTFRETDLLIAPGIAIALTGIDSD
jgi:hypothetical protein